MDGKARRTTTYLEEIGPVIGATAGPLRQAQGRLSTAQITALAVICSGRDDRVRGSETYTRQPTSLRAGSHRAKNALFGMTIALHQSAEC